MRDISRHEEAPTEAALVKIDKDVEIGCLVAEHIRQTVTSGVVAPVWENEGSIGTLIECDIEK